MPSLKQGNLPRRCFSEESPGYLATASLCPYNLVTSARGCVFLFFFFHETLRFSLFRLFTRLYSSVAGRLSCFMFTCAERSFFCFVCVSTLRVELVLLWGIWRGSNMAGFCSTEMIIWAWQGCSGWVGSPIFPEVTPPSVLLFFLLYTLQINHLPPCFIFPP